jgi:two-component system sensor histidine kinase KdpD
MHAPLYRLFVNDPDRFLNKAESLHIETCERLCHEFGVGSLFELQSSKSRGNSEVAKEYRITQTVDLGKASDRSEDPFLRAAH